MAKHKGRVYIAEGKGWDDTNSNEESRATIRMFMADTKCTKTKFSTPLFITLTNLLLHTYISLLPYLSHYCGSKRHQNLTLTPYYICKRNRTSTYPFI